jgi:fatty-acyl-CoA synthase
MRSEAVDSTMGDVALTVGSILRHGATWSGDAEVVTYEASVPRRATYAEVARNAARLSGGLNAIGVSGDDRVGTLMWNNQEHLETYLAVPAMGAVLHSANPRLFPEQLAFTIRAAKDRVMIVDPDLVGALLKVLPTLDDVTTVVVNAPSAPTDVDWGDVAVMTYAELLARGANDYDWPEVDERSAAALCFTTGTTGDPKGVAYSHRSIALQCLSSATSNALRLGANDRALIVVPMFHATAWAYPYAAFWFGADQILPSRDVDPSTIVNLLAQESITFANGVPTVWTPVGQLLRESEADVSALSRVVIGGATLSEALLDVFDALRITLIQGWGMTETSPLVTVGRAHPRSGPEEQRRQRLSQGRVVAGVELRLADLVTGELLPHDGTSVGELELRGPWVTSSYLDGVGADRFVDGWLRTGDIGSVDELGYVRLTDRAKDVIKSGGEWISSVELENAIAGHPDVLEAAVIGVPDPRWDERPCAMVVPVPGCDLTPADLREWLVGRVAKWWIPERWVIAKSIPKTSVGKIDKKAMRADYREESVVLG